MDIKQLIYFQAIAEECSITKAAERLNMAQPPLSKQLKLLENELGVKLIERNTRSIHLTDAGKKLQYRAKQIIELKENTIKELSEYKKGVLGTLRIGSLSSVGHTILPLQIFKFHKKYPKVKFQIKERNSFEVIDMLKNGLIDIGIVRTPIDLNEYNYKLLPSTPMVAATSDRPFWEENQEKISVLELKNQPLLIQNRYENKIIQICKNAGFEASILGKSDDTRSILEWANIGMGIAIVQKDIIELLNETNLKFKVIDEPSLVTKVAIIWMKNRFLNSASKHFLEMFDIEQN